MLSSKPETSARFFPSFHEKSTIELLGVTLHGYVDAHKWLDWMFQCLQSITFDPIVIMVEGDTFFEKFLINDTLKDGQRLQSKQAEVIIYENLLVKHLRLYFDRLNFAETAVSGWLTK